MSKKPVLTVAALALSVGLAHAQTTLPSGPTSSASREASAKYQAIQSVRLSLPQAIDVAEAQGGEGGRAVEAEFERAERREPARFEVKVLLADGRLVEHSIDANTGQIYKTANQPSGRYFTRLRPEDVRAARTSLRQAIATAEGLMGAGSRAIEAEIEREGDIVVIEVDVVTPDREQEFKIDARLR